VDTRHGAYFGVISGALIGLIGGPGGALIGSVAGAAAGAASASLIDLGFPKRNCSGKMSKPGRRWSPSSMPTSPAWTPSWRRNQT
jgi:hypothetical protein